MMLKATALVLITSVCLVEKAHCEPTELATTDASVHLQRTGQANKPLLEWLKTKEADLRGWLQKRGTSEGPGDDLDYYFPETPRLFTPTPAEARRDYATRKLNEDYFHPSDLGSLIGVFFESANPFNYTQKGPYQVDSHKLSRMDNPRLFEDAVSVLIENGVKNMRIGPSLYEIDPRRPATWDRFLQKIETMWRHDAIPTISVAFFPSLKQWEVRLPEGQPGPDGRGIDYQRSYLLNPRWPSDMGLATTGLMKRLWERAGAFEAANPGEKARVILNPVNEPETLAGFNRQFWHGAYANWGHPEMMRYYVPSLIQIAKANVLIRLAAEEASPGRRLLFMHNEAMTPENYPSHHGILRFAVSKFMLGDDLVINTDFDSYKKLGLAELRLRLEKARAAKSINEVDASFLEYVFGSWNTTPAAQESARGELISQFKELQALHRQLVSRTGKTMKTDNMLQLDYYYQTEYGADIPFAQTVQDLSMNQGEKLKRVLDVKDDVLFLAMLKRAMAAAEKRKSQSLGIQLTARSLIDFKDLLTREDGAVLYELTGLRKLDDGRTGLGFEPQHYARQIRAGLRRGFGAYYADYINQLRIFTIGVGESGSPFYVYMPLQQDQVMIEALTVAQAGAYFTQFAVGAVDTRGWAKGPVNNHVRQDMEVNPSGVLSVNPYLDKQGRRAFKVELRGWGGSGHSWFRDWAIPILDKVAPTAQECPALRAKCHVL